MIKSPHWGRGTIPYKTEGVMWQQKHVEVFSFWLRQSHIAKPRLKNPWPRLFLNSWSSCCPLPSARLTGMCHHAQIQVENCRCQCTAAFEDERMGLGLRVAVLEAWRCRKTTFFLREHSLLISWLSPIQRASVGGRPLVVSWPPRLQK